VMGILFHEREKRSPAASAIRLRSVESGPDTFSQGRVQGPKSNVTGDGNPPSPRPSPARLSSPKSIRGGRGRNAGRDTLFHREKPGKLVPHAARVSSPKSDQFPKYRAGPGGGKRLAGGSGHFVSVGS
jgi:hypothetical protein